MSGAKQKTQKSQKQRSHGPRVAKIDASKIFFERQISTNMDLGAFDKRDKLNRSPPPVKNGRATGSQPALTKIPGSGPEPEPASTSSEETQLALSQAMT